MLRESPAPYRVKKQGEYTLEDYYAIPDERRVELIDGEIFDMAAPSALHQMILGELHVLFRQCANEHGHPCRVFLSPCDVRLDNDDKTMVQPDLFVLCREFDIKNRCIDGAPDLTVEILSDSTLDPNVTRQMVAEMEKVDGVNYVLSLESLIGADVPQEILPKEIKGVLKDEKWELMLVNSQYGIATDEVNAQIDSLNSILKKYDPKGLLIGEGPCTKDLIETTDRDFRIVTIVSVLLVFLIIAIVTRSLSLPFILISVIELAIFINLGIPHLTGASMPFVGPIFISTIQLGATVDYAILMTTRYKEERMRGLGKKDAVWTALRTSIPSILVSGTGLFAATIGVAVYSDVDMISSMCILLARGAVVSMILVIFVLPAMLMCFDKVIRKTTAGMKNCDNDSSSETRKELYV